MIKRVALVCTFAFPNGLAATTRIVSYLKGLNEKGVDTDVFIYRPTELYNKSTGLPIDGEIDGVRYHYPNRRVYSKYKLMRVMGRYYYYLVACYRIWKEHKKQKFDFLLISNDFLDILSLYTFWAKMIGIRPVFITDEYPMPIRVHLHNDIPKWKKVLYKHILKYEDSLVFMTDKLNTFFNSELKKPYHILPTITDTSRFDIEVKPADKKYMCYMGNMELSKDNVDNIIHAFTLVSDKYKDIDFYLYGAPSQKDKAIIQGVIKECNMEERVFIKGRVPATEVPTILKKAYLLVSSQPNTKRAEGGFPTKLGEYMATGVPTILTDVGEISQYVKDGVHVHIVPPENPELYAKKLDWMLSNYDKALEIAVEAKKYLYNTFDYRKVSEGLYNFLNKRISEKKEQP